MKLRAPLIHHSEGSATASQDIHSFLNHSKVAPGSVHRAPKAAAEWGGVMSRRCRKRELFGTRSSNGKLLKTCRKTVSAMLSLKLWNNSKLLNSHAERPRRFDKLEWVHHIIRSAAAEAVAVSIALKDAIGVRVWSSGEPQ